MRADGTHIAKDIRERISAALARSGKHLVLGVISVGEDAVTRQFIGIKKKVADELGVSVLAQTLPKTATTEDVKEAVQQLVLQTNGIVVQLPLPKHINRADIFAALPASHDVDCLGDEARGAFETGESPLYPPVVAACKEIFERYSISVAEKNTVVIGKGALVGAPVAQWLLRESAYVTVVDEGDDLTPLTRTADIIVSGAGHPHLLKSDMIKEGVVIIDAGTSESGGKVVGDADPACEEKARLLTPVPGGIGPVAVAKLFENLLLCNSISA